MIMTRSPQFSLVSRILHWVMAALILTMLFIGVGMIASLADYRWLVSIHKPLGVLILLLVSIRLVNRLFHRPPPLPAEMPAWQRALALGSHVVLYALMFALPLVGWGMLSAAAYPITLYGSVQLPPILAPNPELHAFLRTTHAVLAYLLFATFLAHAGAALMHLLIFRDDVFPSMTFARSHADDAGTERTVH